MRTRVFNAAADAARQQLAGEDRPPLPDGLTPHGMRHTFCSLLFAIGKDPRHVMTQLGHTDPAFTLRVYAHEMRRTDAELRALRALVEGQRLESPSEVFDGAGAR